jgi:hypothetical protein
VVAELHDLVRFQLELVWESMPKPEIVEIVNVIVPYSSVITGFNATRDNENQQK